MEIQTLIIFSSGIINLVLILLYARSLRIQTDLTDLIAFSPSICYICLDIGSKHHCQSKWEYPENPNPDLDDHPYVEAHLVYVPSEYLR